ncbi:MAG: glycosyltransferase family 1 protein [Acidobacteriota bacterium]|nr:glycosyltransferase family 1 protein [Acidobacteriota bacterium]
MSAEPAGVLVDGRPLQGATGRRGVGRYVRDLLGGLAASGRIPRLGALIDPRREPPEGFPAGVTAVDPARPPGPTLGWGRLLGPGWIRAFAPELWHATFLAPPRVPRGLPWVATVHDLIPLRHPRRFSRRHRLVFGLSLRWSCRAPLIIAVSRWTADQLVTRLGVEAARIRVVPPPVDLGAIASAGSAGVEGVESPYLLHTGGFDPLKGVDDLLLPAFAQLDRPEIALVLTGGSAAQRRRMRDVVQALGLEGRVHLTGHLTAADLGRALAGAAAVVVSSREEGFGIPAVEALAAGTALVVGPAEATREIARGVGHLADGDDPAALARAMETALEEGGAESPAAESRRRRARLYSRDVVAERMIEVYGEAAGW